MKIFTYSGCLPEEQKPSAPTDLIAQDFSKKKDIYYSSNCEGNEAQYYFLKIPLNDFRDFGPALLMFLFGFSLLITFLHKRKYLHKNKTGLVKKLLLFNSIALILLLSLAIILHSHTVPTHV